MSNDYSQLNQTLSSVNQSDRNESSPNIRSIGPLFANTRRGQETTAPSSRSSRTRGYHPSRYFVWLTPGQRDIPPTTPAESKKVKFPNNASSHTMLDVLRREFSSIGDAQDQSITFYKAAMAGNHALQSLGSNLSGEQIMETFRNAKTKVYIGKTLLSAASTYSTSTTTRQTSSVSVAQPSTQSTDSISTPVRSASPQLISTHTASLQPTSSLQSAVTATPPSSPIQPRSPMRSPSTIQPSSPIQLLSPLRPSSPLLPLFPIQPPSSIQPSAPIRPLSPISLLTLASPSYSTPANDAPVVVNLDDNESLSSSPVRDDVFELDMNKVERGPEYFGQGNRVGTVTEEKSDRGLLNPEGSLLLTSDLRCITLAHEVIGYGGPTFLPVSFKTLCHQGQESHLGLVVILVGNDIALKPTEKQLLRGLSKCTSAGLLYWIAGQNSENGKNALKAFGGSAIRSPQVLLCTPSVGQSVPTIIERFQCSGQISPDDFMRSVESLNRTMSVLKIEREQIIQTRRLRAEQDEATMASLKRDREEVKEQGTQTTVSLDKGEVDQSTQTDCQGTVPVEPEISSRSAKRARVNTPPPAGTASITIKVWAPGGEALMRAFSVGTCYQEVYDWAGSHEVIPLHFTLRKAGGGIAKHRDTIKYSETLRCTERTGEECCNLLDETVSFQGNYEFASSTDDTLPAGENDRNKKIKTDEARENENIQEEGEEDKSGGDDEQDEVDEKQGKKKTKKKRSKMSRQKKMYKRMKCSKKNSE